MLTAMQRLLPLLALLTLLATGARAQATVPAEKPAQKKEAAAEPQQPLVVKLWNNQTAPHSNGLEGPEQHSGPQGANLTNVTEAELLVFQADARKATGAAVLICPGGGYRFLSMKGEGLEVGRWFASQGITAAVLKYRLPNGHSEVPLEDVREGLRMLRDLGEALYIDPARVGVLGSSAGGHLAGCASTLVPDDEKPGWAVLFYPVVTSDPALAHKGSFDNLLGAERTAAQSAAWSLERCITAATPPTMLLLSDDDRVVDPLNSLRYYEALKAQGIPASMHIYPTGNHGWCFNAAFPYKEQWHRLVLDWLRGLGMI